jgi:hypothetical protein
MKRTQSLLFSLIVLALAPGFAHAQAWSGILDPTRAIDWSTAGVPGGIPSGSWTQCGSTIQASTYGNGASDATSGIQAAINACASNQFVLLSPGTFRINSQLILKSNMVLRGAGAASTVLSMYGSNGTYSGAIQFGSGNGPSPSTSNAITAGATQGSTSITISGGGISAGQLMLIGGTNASFMTEAGTGGTCSWCNTGFPGDAGQIVEVTNVAGSTVTFRPPLYFDYSSFTPKAYRFNAAARNAGLESLQVSGNNTGNNTMIGLNATAYCWVYRVETNFADNAHLQTYASIGNEYRDNFFHDGFNHGPGGTDGQLNLASNTSSTLVINNILWRQHVSIMLEWGAAGNVIAYNFMTGNYHQAQVSWMTSDVDFHGAHPFFNLFEGNIGDEFTPDDYWGSSSHTTIFRESITGSRQYVPPLNALGALQIGSAIWEDAGNTFGLDIQSLATYTNAVGVIVGSSHMQGNNPPGWKISPASGFGNNVCIRFGYAGANDTVGPSPNNAYNTAFIHGVYDCQAGTFTWDSGHPNHTLPASFFLNAKPSWWGTVPWPPIGPDVTGGNIAGVNGHANAIPAMNCFNTVTLNGTINTGTFNAATCYVSGPRPNPPIGLAAVVQ